MPTDYEQAAAAAARGGAEGQQTYTDAQRDIVEEIISTDDFASSGRSSQIDAAKAEDWYNTVYASSNGGTPRAPSFGYGVLAASADRAAFLVNYRYKIMTGEIAPEEAYTAIGGVRSTELKAAFASGGDSTQWATDLAASGETLMAQYSAAGVELQECLQNATAAKSDLPTKILDLDSLLTAKLGTNFQSTYSADNFPPGSRPRYTTSELPIAEGDVLYQWKPATYPSANTPTVGDLNTATNQLHGQYVDLSEDDRSKIPWPNYPVVTVTGDARGPLNLALEYFGSHDRRSKPTKRTGTWPTSGDPPADAVTYGYPAGWATVLASIMSALTRSWDFLKNSPTYEEYEAGTLPERYQQNLMDLSLLLSPGASTQIRTLASNSDTDIEAAANARGLSLSTKRLIDRSLGTAISQFEAIDASFAADLQRIKTGITEIFNVLEASVKCQLEAIVKNAANDQTMRGLLASPRITAPAGARARISAQAIIATVDRLVEDFTGENAAQDAAIVEDIADNRNILFKEQCFLLNYIDIFLKQKKDYDSFVPPRAGGKRLPYAQALGFPEATYTPVDHMKKENNACLLVEGDPYGFLNKMTLNPHLKELINIDNHYLSLLQPSIRLFKVVYDDTGGDDDYQVEMKFDSHFSGTDLANFTEPASSRGSGGSRGAGVGIKSFNFSYEGSNPFAIKKSIKANLKIHASTFRELMQDRLGTAKRLDDSLTRAAVRFKYADLALKTGRSEGFDPAAGDGSPPCIDLRRQNENLADLNFRLRAEVGWAAIPGTAAQLPPALIKAIQSSYVTLNLTPTVHNFDFDETGQVVMNINYLAYIEEFFDNKNFNIFAGAKTATGAEVPVTIERIKRAIVLEDIAKKCGQTEDGTNTAAEVKEDFKARVVKYSSQALQHLVSGLIARNEINFIMIEKTKLREYIANNSPNATDAVQAAVARTGTAVDPSELTTRIQAALAAYEAQATADDAADAPAKDAVAAALIAGDGETVTISYFYLSQLVDLILENIGAELEELSTGPDKLTINTNAKTLRLPADPTDPYTVPMEGLREAEQQFKNAAKNFKRLRVVLGPVEFVNHPSNRSRALTNATLGDIPISVKYFVEYMTEKMLKKEEVFYSLTKFLNDLMNEFVRDFLNSRECFRNMKTKIRAQQASLTSWSPNKKHDPLSIKIADKGTRNSILMRGRGSDTARGDDQIQYQMDHTLRHRANINELGTAQSPVLYLSGPPGARKAIDPDHEFNYFVYFAGQVQPIEKMRGRRKDTLNTAGGITEVGDESRGIFHYLLGRDKGLIKTISLSKTQTRGLAEVRFEQDGYDGLRQLRVVYDVEIESFANINTYPGTYIYVDPAGFDPGYNVDKIAMTELGIGGYYMIIRSEHEFSAGKANTKITAKWVNQIEAAAAESACQSLRDSNTGTNDLLNTHCESYATEREQAADVVEPEDRLFDLRWDGLTPW